MSKYYLTDTEDSTKKYLLSQGVSFSIGRALENALIVEDEAVSRHHAQIDWKEGKFHVFNLSASNPILLNGIPIHEESSLELGDNLSVGSQIFMLEEVVEELAEEKELPTKKSNFDYELQVIKGEHHLGARFKLRAGSEAVIGKKPSDPDGWRQLVFLHLDDNVSKTQAKITVDRDGTIHLKDEHSTNGTWVNGLQIPPGGERKIRLGDKIVMGSTTLTVIDRAKEEKTIPVAPPEAPIVAAPVEMAKEEVKGEDWREMSLPRKHLVFAGSFVGLIFVAFISFLTVFSSKPVTHETKDGLAKIEKALHRYPTLVPSYNEATGNLFLTGHVLTEVEHKELMYAIENLKFIRNVEDNVVVDEGVSQSMNSLLQTNPEWQGITLSSPKAGHFIVRGYLQSLEQKERLTDYLNLHFPYLDKLENQVVIEGNLAQMVVNILREHSVNNVQLQLQGGDVVLAGQVGKEEGEKLKKAVAAIKGLQGVRSVSNFVTIIPGDTSFIDLSGKYKITGFARKGGKGNAVLISGKVLAIGDSLPEGTIYKIDGESVLLEKDGLKFKINYSQK